MVQDNFIIAPYKLQHKVALHACIDTVCAESPWMSTDRFEPTPEWERALLGDTDSAVFVAMSVRENKLIGWCRLFPAGQGCMELGIGVHLDYRRMGAGSMLISSALGWARKRDQVSVRLTTAHQNWIAQQLFRKFGFTPGETKHSLLQMACYLDALPEKGVVRQ